MLKMAVLAKQVPDTKHVVVEVMKPDGTLNRAALPAIFNPEDLHALEVALRIKERVGGHVTVITMGPVNAAEVLRDSLSRGADAGVLLTDRRLAGSDTLATSIALAAAVRRISPLDMVLCGRQAIDGDTAQTGPQTAQKLGLPQVTYVAEVREVGGGKVTFFRRLGRHAELVESPLPVFITVTSDAGEARPPRAKRMLKYRRARVLAEVRNELAASGATGDELERKVEAERARLEKEGLLLPTWGVDELGLDAVLVGIAGSPTKVKRCENVVLKTGEFKQIEPTEAGARTLIGELVHDHILG
ncbi:MAG: electron transfer flavoprotein subunit beta/FixA family protein [Planctomycetota bacterium]|nr:electron transfer flavoprotein subunit beta/FixA family protein [Planctomycetota bacterium]